MPVAISNSHNARETTQETDVLTRKQLDAKATRLESKRDGRGPARTTHGPESSIEPRRSAGFNISAGGSKTTRPARRSGESARGSFARRLRGEVFHRRNSRRLRVIT